MTITAAASTHAGSPPLPRHLWQQCNFESVSTPDSGLACMQRQMQDPVAASESAAALTVWLHAPTPSCSPWPMDFTASSTAAAAAATTHPVINGHMILQCGCHLHVRAAIGWRIVMYVITSAAIPPALPYSVLIHDLQPATSPQQGKQDCV